MSTWHQDQAAHRGASPLFHPTDWTVVTDPPNRTRTVMRVATKEEAEQYEANIKQFSADNPQDIERRIAAEHTYILPPSGKGVSA